MGKTVTADSSLTATFHTKISNDFNGLEEQKNDLQIASLFWIKVNEVTHKLTIHGEMSRTPASHGQWGGYNTEAALAWVMEVGWSFKKKIGFWYARCGNRNYGPTDLGTAKRAALALANGAPSFPDRGLAMTFDGPVNLYADPEVDAERRKLAATLYRLAERAMEFDDLTESNAGDLSHPA